MTNRVEVCYRRYSDHRGRPVWVRATRTPGKPWREHWTTAQLMAVDLSHDPDTQERRPVVYRTTSNGSQGSQPHNGSPKRGRAAKNNSNREGAKHG